MIPFYASQAWLSESANDPASGEGGALAVLLFCILLFFLIRRA